MVRHFAVGLVIFALCAISARAGTFGDWSDCKRNDLNAVTFKTDGSVAMTIGAAVNGVGSKAYIGTSKYNGLSIKDIRSFDLSYDIPYAGAASSDPTWPLSGPSPYIDIAVDLNSDGIADGALSWSVGKPGYNYAGITPFCTHADGREYSAVRVDRTHGGWWWCDSNSAYAAYTTVKNSSDPNTSKHTLEEWQAVWDAISANGKVANTVGAWSNGDPITNNYGVRISYGASSGNYSSEMTANVTDFSLTTATVPEPGTVALLLTAVPCAAIYLHRRRQRRS